MSGGAPLWLAIASATHLAGACASVTVMALLWGQRGRYMGAGWAILLSLATSALWCLAVAVDGPVSLMGQGALGLRNLSYLWLIWRMFASDGRHTSVVQIGPVVLALALVD
ncbi:MAG TPA: hypothetical protein VN222_00590, partial [Novosphingobium sp.]|nr:hypothetical protein [Novosphingobium sp.]